MIPLSTSIYTPTGWKSIADCNVGDEIYTPDGDIQTLSYISEPEVQSLFALTFRDERSIKVSRYQLFSRLFRKRFVDYENFKESTELKKEIISAETIYERMQHLTRYNKMYIEPCCIKNTDIKSNFVLHPYILGALIGDAYLGSCIVLSTEDAIVERIKSFLPSGIEIRLKERTTDISGEYRFSGTERNGSKIVNPVIDELVRYNLRFHRSWQKFIPEDYLYAPYNDRLELIRGLMDTDGTANEENNSIKYSTISEQLALDVQYLFRSMGCIARLRVHRVYKNNKTTGGPAEHISREMTITAPYPRDFFTLERKRNKVTETTRYTEGFRLLLISIVPLPEKEPCVWIKTSSKENEFVANDFIRLVGQM